MPVVTPMISYEDGVAALDWLTRAFGFVERERWTDADGRLTHGELAIGDGVVMLASPTAEYESPVHHRSHCAEAAAWSRVPYIIDGVLVEVDDVDAHCARARAAGALILSEPETGGEGFRHYRAEDPEGHRWMFSGPAS
jgi:uncharacterized glyoxalase superfamily protein PhnB